MEYFCLFLIASSILSLLLPDITSIQIIKPIQCLSNFHYQYHHHHFHKHQFIVRTERNKSFHTSFSIFSSFNKINLSIVSILLQIFIDCTHLKREFEIALNVLLIIDNTVIFISYTDCHLKYEIVSLFCCCCKIPFGKLSSFIK